MAQTRRVQDRSHPPHPQRFQTTLTTAQEAVADALRKTQRVSLDDLLAVVREFLNLAMSRSGRDLVCVGMERHAFVIVQPRMVHLSTVA